MAIARRIETYGNVDWAKAGSILEAGKAMMRREIEEARHSSPKQKLRKGKANDNR